MSDRPDDIPQDIWDYAEAVEKVWRELPLPGAIEHHARAIDQARREGYAAGVRAAADLMERLGSEVEDRGCIDEEIGERTMAYAGVSAIRALDGKGEWV